MTLIIRTMQEESDFYYAVRALEPNLCVLCSSGCSSDFDNKRAHHVDPFSSSLSLARRSCCLSSLLKYSVSACLMASGFEPTTPLLIISSNLLASLSREVKGLLIVQTTSRGLPLSYRTRTQPERVTKPSGAGSYAATEISPPTIRN